MIIHRPHTRTAQRRAFGPALVVAVVVLVQLLAPIGAVRFIAAAIADPVTVAPLCAAMADRSPDSAPAADEAGCCVICSIASSGSSVPALPPQHHVVTRFAQTVVWHPGDPAMRYAPGVAHAQARGPPAALPASA